ncbi:Phage lysozyme [compost metagenome]
MNIVDQLKRDEGIEKSAYIDSLGYLTIGVGRLIDAKKGGGLSNEEIDFLLMNDIRSKESELSNKVKFYNKLDDARKGVLLNMAFNLGVGGLLKFKNTLRLVEIGDYKSASVEMLNSTWARQVGSRAKRLSKQMLTGEWQ